MMWGYFGPYGAGMGWWMALTALFWIALFALAIWAVVRFTGSRRSSGQVPPTGLSAEEILRQRFARGEIDAETYEAMRERLAGGSRVPEQAPPRS